MSLAQLAKNITCHVWNGDGTKVALCPNNNEIHVYSYRAPNTFSLLQKLTDHDQLVSGLDWHPTTNKIVSCSHDRNAYVWSPDTQGNFTPSLCILQINRAATCVKWSPQGNKFAVGSGAKVVSVCHFEVENDWWVPKQFPAHDSTVLSLAWHPNNLVLATGSSDNLCRVFSAYHKDCDGKLKQPKLGEKLAEFNCSSGWVHSVAWSPSGASLGFVSHDASLYVADLAHQDADGLPTVHTVRCGDLPFSSLTFLSEQAVIAAGHSWNPTLFTFEGGRWVRKAQIDKKKGATAAPAAAGGSSDVRAAFARFQTAAAAAPAASSSAGSSSGASKSAETTHQNPITDIKPIGQQSGTVQKVSTVGLDGKIVMWNLPTLGIEELTRALAL